MDIADVFRRIDYLQLVVSPFPCLILFPEEEKMLEKVAEGIQDLVCGCCPLAILFHLFGHL